jgi:LuxR family maltose regulon positive regulatory protein
MASSRGDRTSVPLIAAKRAVPPVRPNTVARGRLHQRLRTNHATRLSVVIAPAGWGKTTLLSHWANDPQESRPIAWVSLDDRDDDPGRFWTYVLSALHESDAKVGGDALAIVTTPNANAVDAALATFLNELAESDARHVLVLDDYHQLSATRIHETVEFLLAYAAPQLHVVIASRLDPPLPLARLRSRGELTEIRAADLRFDETEAGRLVASVSGSSPDSDTTARIVDATEGWAAGLQLAALRRRVAPDPDESSRAMRGDDRHILDYFTTEVLPNLDDEQRALLRRTSVFETISAPLCDAVLDRAGSRAVLERLDRDDLFVVPLDPQHQWYRCHRLFRDALRWELEYEEPGALPEIYSRAAKWFRANGEVEEAVRACLLAGNDGDAVELLGTAFAWFVERGRAEVFLRLGERAAEAAATRPYVCLALAWVAGAVCDLNFVV